MSSNQPSLAGVGGAPGQPLVVRRLKWLLWGGLAAVGVGAAAGIAVLSSSHPATRSGAGPTPVQTFAAGTRRAPAFTLQDQSRRTFSLSGYRGRPVIVTFIDPLCRNFCPREARILSTAVKQLGSGAPGIVSVSVNPWADTAHNFRLDAVRWRLAPAWRWGVASQAKLAAVWKSYGIGVVVAKKVIAGITLRTITHTEAAYLIDATGHERALLLYPFTAKQVVDAAKSNLGPS
jgi:cytochrome oxidase Cu insertion factor (SCO1/SenC/PrrC family)